MINFGIIGAGWRSEFYIRIALALPEKFNVTGIYVRNAKKQKEFKKKYSTSVFSDLEDLINTAPSFIVSCVNKDTVCDEIEMLCSRGIAVLSETPIGTAFDQLESFKKKIKPDWRVQVAEQFHFQPRNQAYKKIIENGILGDVNQVQLSCCHDYHAVSLIRYFLNAKNKIPKITSVVLNDPIIRYNSRDGIIAPTEVKSQQKVAILNYGGKSAIYDFNIEQYFSDIRSSKIIIKGTKGEIINNTCTYLDGSAPIQFTLNRSMSGAYENLDGPYLKFITGNGRILYDNPFKKAHFSDEEIAVATTLIKMDDYLKTGKEFYSLQSAMIDAFIALSF